MIKTTKLLNLIVIPIAMISLVVFAGNKSALAKSDTSNIVTFSIGYKTIDRTKVLEKFFRKYNSPLEKSAETFVKVADLYGLDYSFLPSVACVESTCAKFLVDETYNPFGWGGGYIKFNSYDEAIENVGKGLNEIYLSRGFNTPALIAPIYTPPNHYNWLRGVEYFSNEISGVSKNM